MLCYNVIITIVGNCAFRKKGFCFKLVLKTRLPGHRLSIDLRVRFAGCASAASVRWPRVRARAALTTVAERFETV